MGNAAIQTVRFKKEHADAIIPTRAHASDAGLDLSCIKEVVLHPGFRELVDTGLSIAIPAGYAGFVTPRSGLANKFGITVTNSPGIIDSSYRGPLKVILENTYTGELVKLPAGSRIAQLLIVPISLASPVEVEDLEDTDRGAGGFGSTGA